MTRLQHDEEVSGGWRMDVVHEVDDRPGSASQWVEAMRSLNMINDPLARKLLELHRDCGSGSGVCDDAEDDPDAIVRGAGWGCETTGSIADHFGVDYPAPPASP